MKKLTLVLLILSLLVIGGCKENNKKTYLPVAENDKVFTVVGGREDNQQKGVYTIQIPMEDYHYEKDYDDGNLEEIWEYKKKDDVEIKVTTYKNTDEITARGKFLRANEDYIFEDLTGYSLCGTELDGDTLWFHAHESNGTTYIVSWEYPKNTDEELKKELANIAESFNIIE